MKQQCHNFFKDRFQTLLFACLAILLSLVSSLLLPQISNAISPFDGAYRKIDKLEMAVNGFGVVCGPDDYTFNWSEPVLDTSTHGSSIPTDLSSKFQNALNNGTWAVSQQTAQQSYTENTIVIWFTESSGATIEFENVGGAPSVVFKGNTTTVHRVLLTYRQWQNGNGGCNPLIENYYNLGTGTTSESVISNGSFMQNYLATPDVNYPEGYEGEPVSDGASIDTAIRPDIKYDVVDKSYNAKDHPRSDFPSFEVDEGYTFNGWEVEWTLFECSAGYGDDTICDGEQTLKKYDILPVDTQFKDSVSNYGQYKLSAQYVAQQCYRYPSYPATPDYCFYVVSSEENGIKDFYFPPTSVILNIDGSTFSGDTTGITCDVSGYCPVEQENNEIWDLFTQADTVNTFGLTSFVLAPINFYRELPEMANNCSPISIPLFGNNISIACPRDMYWSWNPVVMTIFTVIINATVSYAIAINIFRHIKDINTPHKDSIEVAKL